MKKAFVFDFDDTLVKTDCRIGVKNENGVWLFGLTPQQFNSYKLRNGEKFDFSDFEYVINPVGLETLELAKQVSNEQHDVYILTARSSVAENPIAEFVKSQGLKVKEIYCVGDNGDDIAKEKRTVLMTIIEAYDKVYFYDDHHDNVEQAKTVGVKAYKV